LRILLVASGGGVGDAGWIIDQNVTGSRDYRTH